MPVLSCIRSIAVLTVLACLVGRSDAHAQATVYNQSTDLGGSFASQNDTGNTFGAYATDFDNFTLANATNIGTVTWIGDYSTGNPGTITAFTLKFYSDNGGTPGSLLQTTPISGNANETGIGLDQVSNPYFSYSATLPSAFGAAANTPYWMSIVADLAYPPQWGWETATGGDNAAYQNYFGTGSPLNKDLAFSLVSTPDTPEPGSLALLIGLCVSGCACLGKRRYSHR
jgi:hypothetical protein